MPAKQHQRRLQQGDFPTKCPFPRQNPTNHVSLTNTPRNAPQGRHTRPMRDAATDIWVEGSPLPKIQIISEGSPWKREASAETLHVCAQKFAPITAIYQSMYMGPCRGRIGAIYNIFPDFGSLGFWILEVYMRIMHAQFLFGMYDLEVGICM